MKLPMLDCVPLCSRFTGFVPHRRLLTRRCGATFEFKQQTEKRIRMRLRRSSRFIAQGLCSELHQRMGVSNKQAPRRAFASPRGVPILWSQSIASALGAAPGATPELQHQPITCHHQAARQSRSLALQRNRRKEPLPLPTLTAVLQAHPSMRIWYDRKHSLAHRLFD